MAIPSLRLQGWIALPLLLTAALALPVSASQAPTGAGPIEPMVRVYAPTGPDSQRIRGHVLAVVHDTLLLIAPDRRSKLRPRTRLVDTVSLHSILEFEQRIDTEHRRLRALERGLVTGAAFGVVLGLKDWCEYFAIDLRCENTFESVWRSGAFWGILAGTVGALVTPNREKWEHVKLRQNDPPLRLQVRERRLEVIVSP